MDSPDRKLPVPPYVAYKTLKNFVERFRNGLPGRIDRGLMSSMSGAAQSQVTTALRYLGFIDEGGIPTNVMKQYVEGDDKRQSEVMDGVLRSSYPFIFGQEAKFGFSTATGSQLREEFEARTSATGETVQRCIGFLREAAYDAGMAISPYLTQTKSSGSPRRKRASTKRKAQPVDRAKDPSPPPSVPQQEHSMKLPVQDSLLIWGLLQRLPKPGAVWPVHERGKWLETLNNVIGLEYPES